MKDENIEIKSGITEDEYQWIINSCSYIGIDTETTGLDPMKDKLSFIQIEANNRYFIIRYDYNMYKDNIIKLLLNKDITKVFHNATFDIGFLTQNFAIKEITNVVCTKIGYKILHGITESSSLKDLLTKYLNVTINKDQQLSNWESEKLSNEQLKYAINDVRYLVELWKIIDKELNTQGYKDYAKNCFDFITTQIFLNCKGIKNIFIY